MKKFIILCLLIGGCTEPPVEKPSLETSGSFETGKCYSDSIFEDTSGASVMMVIKIKEHVVQYSVYSRGYFRYTRYEDSSLLLMYRYPNKIGCPKNEKN